MDAERLEDRLARLDRERVAADEAYNAALTALDRAIEAVPALPAPPPAFDTSKLPELNRTWDLLPGGAPPIDRTPKGRLRGFIWRLVGPALDTQRRFNAALVEHLNREVDTRDAAQRALEAMTAYLSERAHALARFQSHLIQYLQTVTLYVDTKDRAGLGQVQVLNAGLSALTDDWLKRWESLGAREERFMQRLSGATASLADLRATTSLAQQTALSLKREVEKLLASRVEDGARPAAGTPAQPAAPATAPDLDAFKYLGFEDAFRGSAEAISGRLRTYLPKFEGLDDVLDVGCGRGEFLELLRDRGIAARGLDLNDAMVEHARARGLDVVKADALGYLQGIPDRSLGGLFAAQVVEHLEPGYLMALLETAGQKLRPGAVIVLETINPACWVAFFESYIRDLTHVRPLHPETLQYLLRVSGFHDVTIEFTSPVAGDDRLRTMPRPDADGDPLLIDLVDTLNDNAGKLNARLFTFQDYAAIGRV